MSTVTFGSVGDIIAVCQIAKSIFDALDDSKGSSAEYQGLIIELRSLESSLFEVKGFIHSWRDSSTSASLQRECSKLVNECRKTLENFKAYLKKYDTSLSKDSRQGLFKRAATSIKWQNSAKDPVSRFRSELAGHSNALNMMMVTANMRVSLKSLDKQNASSSSTERSLAAQDAVLDTLRKEIHSNSEHASSMTSRLRTMSQQFSWFTKLLVEVKSMVSQGFTLNLATQRAVMSIEQSLSHLTHRIFIQEPFKLEDPLGRVIDIDLRTIISWNAFYAVVAAHFEKFPGHNKVERREFVLQERATSREISVKEAWNAAFRPGASVLMSFVFQRDVKTSESKSHCPYCGYDSERESTDDVHCEKCGVIYRRVTEITEIDQPSIPELPKYWNQQPSFGQTGFNKSSPALGPFPKRKRTMETWEELSLSEEVRGFKRVRVLSNMKKPRRAAFTSWERKAPWVATEQGKHHAVSFPGDYRDTSSLTTEVDTRFRNFSSRNVVPSASSSHLSKFKSYGPRELCHRYLVNLQGIRAHLLEKLPGGPILAPISEQLRRVLDIGSSVAWQLVVTPRLPNRRISGVRTGDNQSSKGLFDRLDNLKAEPFDLIHIQDWAVPADSLPILTSKSHRILRPGGWIEIEVLELQMKHSSCVQLQVFPVLILQSLSSIGIKGFSTAEGMADLLEEASFTNIQTTVQRIPISDEEALGGYPGEMWLLALKLVKEVAKNFGEPRRSSRLSMIEEIRAAVCDRESNRMDFMNLVRITAQRSVRQHNRQ